MSAENTDDEHNANVVISSPKTGMDLGEVCREGAKAAAVNSGPIRLLQGRSGGRGFGLKHIEEPGRTKAIAGRGFQSCKEYVFHVAAQWSHLYKGENGRLIVASQCNGGFNSIVLQWKDGYWSVVTGLPFRAPNEPLMFTKTRSGESEPPPALAARPRFETLTLPKPKSS